VVVTALAKGDFIVEVPEAGAFCRKGFVEAFAEADMNGLLDPGAGFVAG